MVLLKYNMTIWNPWFYSIVQAYAGRCINHLLQRQPSVGYLWLVFVLAFKQCDMTSVIDYLMHVFTLLDEIFTSHGNNLLCSVPLNVAPMAHFCAPTY